jgi:uncharacterized cupredoxin-like copper-binding protein
MRTLKARLAPLLPFGAAALFAAGCATSQSAHGASTTLVPASTTTTTFVASTSTSGSASATTTPSANTVTASEVEFHITLSQQSFAPGKYTFKAINAGTTVHNLAITGPGVSAVTNALSPGQSAELTVTLQKGTYDVFCAIDDHKALGMNVNVTVS